MAETQRDMTNGKNGAPGPTSAVGALLRQARERSGQSLASAAQQLRIRDSYLRAIEEGDFRRLPGATYAVGFLRSYADHLGLDPQEVVRRFREEVEELGRRTQLVFPAAPAEGKIPGGAILLIAAVVALIGYGGWYFLSERDGNIADLVPAVPSGLQALFAGGESSPAATVTEVAPEPAAAASTTVPSAAAPTTDLNDAVAEAIAASASAPSGAEAAVPAPAELGTAASATATVAQSAATVASGPTAPGTGADDAPASAPTGDLATAENGPLSDLGTGEETADMVPETPSEVTDAAAAAGPSPNEGAEPAAPTDDAAVGTAVAMGSDGIPAAPEPPSATEDLPEGQQYGVTNADARVVLIATQEAWVQIKKASGEEVWTKVLRPGDRFMVPNERGLVLATGNAGGLQVVVDGKRVAALGPIGVVRRGILLDPQRLLDGTAVP